MRNNPCFFDTFANNIFVGLMVLVMFFNIGENRQTKGFVDEPIKGSGSSYQVVFPTKWIGSDLRLASYREDSDASWNDSIESIGAIRTIDDGSIVVMKESSKDRIRIPHVPGETIYFTSHLDDSQLEPIAQLTSKNANQDKLFLHNGDEFEGRFLRLDLRFVYFRAFDVELKIPRYRVRALVWNRSSQD